MRTINSRVGAALLAAAIVFTSLSATASRTATAQPAPLPTVIGKKVLGYSLAGRPINAYHLGNPRASIKAVLVGQMHGDEHAGVVVARSVIAGRPIKGINLWVIPTMNPDGNAASRRGNNRGVDLNRNWPDIWVPLSGLTYSGPYPLSEPETRAMYNFIAAFKPTHLVSVHQPLYGVDTTDGGARNLAFRDRLARNLGLPLKAFRCGSICHGSMTGWITTHQAGSAITVEYGYRPTATQLTSVAPRGIIGAFGGSYDSLAAHTPVRHVERVGTTGSTVRIDGWAFDPDIRNSSMLVRVMERTTVRWRHHTLWYRPDVNRIYRLSGNHGFRIRLTAGNGTHTYCVVYVNVGPGSEPKWCTTLRVDGSPRGAFGNATTPSPSVVRLSGWMFDPDATATSGQVRVRVDGVVVGTFPANLARDDVNRVFGIAGDHGFVVRLTAQPAGTHSYCVSAINLGPPAPNRDLGCRSLTVAAAPPAPTAE